MVREVDKYLVVLSLLELSSNFMIEFIFKFYIEDLVVLIDDIDYEGGIVCDFSGECVVEKGYVD